MIRSREARLLFLGTTDPDDPASSALPDGMVYVPMSCQSEGALQVFIEPVVPVLDLLVVGRSPMVQLLAELANDAGLERPGRRPAGAQRRRHRRAVARGRGHPGARRRGGARAVRPGAAGVPRAWWPPASAGSRCWSTSPSGVSRRSSSTACTPRRAGPGPHLAPRDRGGRPRRAGAAAALRVRSATPREEAAGVPEPAATSEATDPVCGMTVTVDASGWSANTHEHDGTTYHFCCVGCRDRFAADPDATTSPVRRPETMLISNEFEVPQPVGKVWEFFQDVPGVAACLPGAELTDDLGDDEYAGTVEPADGAGQARVRRQGARRRSGTRTPGGWSSTRPAPTRRAAATSR